MNVKLLEQVKGAILKHPENFDMELYAYGTVVADKQAPPECGTTACIAGWAIAIHDGVVEEPQSIGQEMKIWQRAEEVLDLDSEQGRTLFHVSKWPEVFRRGYKCAESDADMAQIAAERIDRFIVSNGRD